MEKPRSLPSRPFRSRRALILSASALLVIAIALAVGLGVGLTRNSSSSNSSTPSSPTPTIGPINSTFSLWPVNTTWQIVLDNPIVLNSSNTSVTPDVEVFDIDLFNNADSVIKALHDLDKKVICYFSAGSYEPGRPDSSKFQSSDMGNGLSGWPGERWLNISSPGVQTIMTARIQLAAQKGCDAVDPDNVDGYLFDAIDLAPNGDKQNDNGLGLTANDSISYMNFLANTAHSYAIGIGLKNALDILPSLYGQIQFAVNEQCLQYDECSSYDTFLQSNKAVFHIEYVSSTMAGTQVASIDVMNKACSVGNLSTVVKNQDLDGWVEYCGGSTANTPTSSSS